MDSKTAVMLAGARQAVLGVVTARIHDNADGAFAVIDDYIRTAGLQGYTVPEAWAQLFASAVLLIIPLMECRSDHHDEDITDTLQELGIALAEYKERYG